MCGAEYFMGAQDLMALYFGPFNIYHAKLKKMHFFLKKIPKYFLTVRSKNLSDAGSRMTSQMFEPKRCLTRVPNNLLYVLMYYLTRDKYFKDKLFSVPFPLLVFPFVSVK